MTLKNDFEESFEESFDQYAQLGEFKGKNSQMVNGKSRRSEDFNTGFAPGTVRVIDFLFFLFNLHILQ